MEYIAQPELSNVNPMSSSATVCAGGGTTDRVIEVTWMRHAESTSNLISFYLQHLRNQITTFPNLNKSDAKLLIQHCKSRYAWNAPLTQLGRLQVRDTYHRNHALFSTISAQNGPYRGVILCSYLRRAIETAVLLAGEISKSSQNLKSSRSNKSKSSKATTGRTGGNTNDIGHGQFRCVRVIPLPYVSRLFLALHKHTYIFISLHLYLYTRLTLSNKITHCE